MFIRHCETGNYEKALEAYNKALEKNPEYVEVYCNIGVIYKNLGNTHKAVEFYENALKLAPNFKIARDNLAVALTDIGTLFKQEGNTREAIDLYQKVSHSS